MSTITLTREQLYERVWTDPATTVAAELGISSVALKKTCKKLNIPTPSRGYWSSLAVGLELPQEPLPSGTENTSVTFDVEANLQRREKIQQERASIPVDGPPRLPLPADCSKLHPVIADLYKVLKSAKPTYDELIHEDDSRLPTVYVSPANIQRVVRVLSALCSEMENRGIPFKRDASKQDVAFRNGNDAVKIVVQEMIEVIEREPTAEEKRRPSWEWQTKIRRPSGRFRFMLRSAGHIPGRSDWRESPRNELEVILHAIADQITAFFPAQDEQRKREAELQKQREEQEKVRREQERVAIHNQKLDDLAARRVTNLVRAAEWWRLHQNASTFVTDCEKRWREQPGGTTTEQEQWLAWARTQAAAIAPAAMGYPQPANDGDFDRKAVPLGGPYPEYELLPLPPTMQQPAHRESNSYWSTPSRPEPYPFWLKYQH